MIGLGEWSEARHAALAADLTERVTRTAKEAESYGTIDQGPPPPVATMFEDVYKEMPWHLERQRRELEG